MSNKTDATFYDPRKPCKGVNSNVCVGEGCYGEECLRVSIQKVNNEVSRFSGQDSTENDFPVKNEKPVKNRFSGLKTAGEAFGLMMVGFIMLVIVGCGLAMLGVLVAGWMQAFIIYPVGTGLGTGIVILIYILCYIAVKKGYKI